MQEFQLKIIPLKDNNFFLELYQCAYKKARQKKRPSAQCMGKVKGNKLVLIRRKRSEGYATKGIDSFSLSRFEVTIASSRSSELIAVGIKDGVEIPCL